MPGMMQAPPAHVAALNNNGGPYRNQYDQMQMGLVGGPN